MADIIQTNFKRYEKKYMLNRRQQENLMNQIMPYIKEDKFGKYTICNIYYDTEDWELIRRSIQKPVYKEKLRVRSYGVPADDGKAFIEIKKKYKGIVYKRRITAEAKDVQEILTGASGVEIKKSDEQIRNEIMWFQNFYRTQPRIFIGYDRQAFAGIQDSGLRITFDTNLRWRDEELDLRCGDYGKPVLQDEQVLMEIKMPGTCPLWLAHILNENRIYPTSFSKYGTCYKNFIINREEILSA